MRYFDEEAWYIDFDTLADLLAFYEQYGALVIDSDWRNGEPSIEIYDGYRE